MFIMMSITYAGGIAGYCSHAFVSLSASKSFTLLSAFRVDSLTMTIAPYTIDATHYPPRTTECC